MSQLTIKTLIEASEYKRQVAILEAELDWLKEEATFLMRLITHCVVEGSHEKEYRIGIERLEEIHDIMGDKLKELKIAKGLLSEIHKQVEEREIEIKKAE